MFIVGGVNFDSQRYCCGVNRYRFLGEVLGVCKTRLRVRTCLHDRYTLISKDGMSAPGGDEPDGPMRK